MGVIDGGGDQHAEPEKHELDLIPTTTREDVRHPSEGRVSLRDFMADLEIAAGDILGNLRMTDEEPLNNEAPYFLTAKQESNKNENAEDANRDCVHRLWEFVENDDSERGIRAGVQECDYNVVWTGM